MMPTGYWKDFIQQQQQPQGGVQNLALQSINQSPYQNLIGELQDPINIETGLTAPWYQQAFNRMRGQIQTGTKTNLEQMQKYTGGRGFRPGESGMADTLMGGVARQGAERLASGSGELAAHQLERGFGQKLSLEQLNLQRKLGGAGLALEGEEGALNRMMQMYGLQTQEELARWQPYWAGISGSYDNPFTYGG
jgi:hypothetical protein